MKPLVTVIIPVFNQEKLIIRAIESIPARDDIEIIVIDDGSTDKTWKTIQEYRDNQTKYKNLILLYNKKNQGVAHAVNKGYDYAKGEYVVCLGSDDYFYTDLFEQALKELDGTDLIYFDMKINNGDIWEINNDSKMVLVGSVKFIRREFMDDTRCPECYRSGEDKFFYWRLLEKKPTEKFTHIPLKHYNHPREGSLTNLVERGELPRV